MTQNEIALEILNMGKDGYKNDAEGFEKINKANALIEKHVKEQLLLHGVSSNESINEVVVCKHGFHHVEEIAVVVCTECEEILGRQTDC
ncbi:MAG: hypothetical protein GY745_18530 [Actinomycetia bacterium]|nr:hypothetical protein [Actinomycetes bacterium]